MSMLDSPNIATAGFVRGGMTRAAAKDYDGGVAKATRLKKTLSTQQKTRADGTAYQSQPRRSSGEPSPKKAADRTDGGDVPPSAEPAGDMRREEDRLATFGNGRWKVPFMRPEEMAANGFYYFGSGDEVRCAFCRVEIGHWEEDDDPAVDHERWSPQCALLRRRPSGNVPLPRGRDECGTRAAAPPAAPLDATAAAAAVGASVPTARSGPAHPAYAGESARLRSFDEWPRSLRQKPEQLANAGFYYTGQGDKTVCFYCGGGLKDWESDDDPWEQHAKWFGRCAYVLLNKGVAYVHKVNKILAALAPETPAAAPASTAVPACDGPSPKTEDEPPAVDDKNLCKICYANERDVCFLPCGHVVACSKCALSSSTCPLCRTPFTSTVRLFYS